MPLVTRLPPRRPAGAPVGELDVGIRRNTATRCCALATAVLALALVPGCKPRRKSVPPGPKITKVTVEGAQTLEPDEIAVHMNLRPSKVLGDKNYYTPRTEVLDEERIEELYAAHGHYDADVVSIDVDVRHPDRKVQRQRARVHVEVNEGPATHIEAIDWRWEPAVSFGVPFSREVVERAANLEIGDTFSIPAFEASEPAILDAMRDQGYALATLTRRAEVDRKLRRAKISYVATPGERYTIERVDIEGLVRIREDLVRREVGGALGRTYSPALLRQTESSVYGLDVFGTVSVTPGDIVAPGKIALVVRVREREMQQFGLGVLLEVDPIRWSQRAGFRYEYANLFNNITKFETHLLAGYAQLPYPFRVQAHGPRADLDFRLSKRGLLERKLLWSEEPSIGVDIFEGYQYWYIKNRASVSRFLGKVSFFGLSYNNRFIDYFNVTGGLLQQLARAGIPVPDPYIDSYLELQGELFRLDNLMTPTQGIRLVVTYQFANRYLGSNFDYHRVEPELRGYLQPHDRIQLAARVRLGFILPYRGSSAPFDRRLYLGGVSDMRGWPLRRLSPRVEVCDDGGQNCRSIPIGGNTSVLGNFELRVRVWQQLWLAAFGDVGDIQSDVATIRPAQWFYTAGGGIRYGTPLGPVRVDVGVVLNPQERYPERRPWAIHLTLGEAF